MMIDSTLKAIALLACLAILPARAVNHEEVVPPGALGRFAVACSNVEVDTGKLAALGGNATDYWEGNPAADGRPRYITDILAHPETAFTFEERVPFKPAIYPTRWLTRMELRGDHLPPHAAHEHRSQLHAPRQRRHGAAHAASPAPSRSSSRSTSTSRRRASPSTPRPPAR
jgi:hypothetical protein